MVCSIPSQAPLDYTPAERKEEGVCTASKMLCAKKNKQSLKSYVSRKAESDPLMAECKRLIATWKEPDETAAWYEKFLHVAWHKGVSEVVDMTRTYQWLNKSNIRVNTEALNMAAQEQALNTGAVSHEIYHTVQDPKCRLCKQHAETVAHITSGCSKLWFEHNSDFLADKVHSILLVQKSTLLGTVQVLRRVLRLPGLW